MVQFNFDESINAKKKALNGLVPNPNSSAALAGLASERDVSKSQQVDADECDKEKMEAIKNKQKQASAAVFDMFADDEDYETVSRRFFPSILPFLS